MTSFSYISFGVKHPVAHKAKGCSILLPRLLNIGDMKWKQIGRMMEKTKNTMKRTFTKLEEEAEVFLKIDFEQLVVSL